MNSTDQIKLIDGNFTEMEAREILLNVVSTKIHYHGMKNFSSKERSGKEDQSSLIRIAELKQALFKINEFLLQAKKKKQRIKIYSTINISVLED